MPQSARLNNLLSSVCASCTKWHILFLPYFQVTFFQPPGKANEDEKEDSEEKPKQKKSRRSDLKVVFNIESKLICLRIAML